MSRERLPSLSPNWRIRLLAASASLILAPLPAAENSAAAERSEEAEILTYFANPPKHYRPFVRWWWNGARVTAEEAGRQLDLLEENGIGGVEINTLRMPDEVPEPLRDFTPALEWLSPEWCAVLEAAAIRSRELGLTADVIIGSGWPFGGEFLPVDHQSKRVQTARVPVEGGATYRATVAEIARFAPEEPPNKQRWMIHPPARREILSMLLMERGDADGQSVRVIPLDLENTHDAQNGSIAVDVPPGNYELMVSLLDVGYTKVKLGAPGASGPVLDHFNREAVSNFLIKMSGTVQMELFRDLSSLVRATFTDSMELEGANWTNDFAETFERRRGYDILPLLPLLLIDPEEDWGAELKQDVRDMRYDFYRTLVELFDERYLSTYVQWSEANGPESRMQAYGPTIHPLHGSMRVSLPEGETWLWRNSELQPPGINIDSTVANKYVSSGAHLSGHKTVSFEAMTNPTAVTRETLQDFKRGMDASILDGVNHPILHGFNYSPLEAGFPGWVRFGIYLNERVPYWKHFKLFSDYASRLGVVFRNSEYVARIAVLAPLGEEWERHGLVYQPFPEPIFPWYQYLLVDAFQMHGVGADFVSEEIIQESGVRDGKLRYDHRDYDVIVLEDVSALNVATAEQLADFAEAGGRLIAIGGLPERALGFQDSESNSRRVAEAMARAVKAGATRYDSPEIPADHIPHTKHHFRGMPQDYASVLELSGRILEATNVEKDVEIGRVTADLSQVHHVDEQGNHYYFFANSSLDNTVDTPLRFPAALGRPILMDALTGSIGGSLPEAGDGGYQLRLPPLESALLRFGDSDGPHDHSDRAARPRFHRSETVDRIEFTSDWKLSFQTVDDGPSFARRYWQLDDLSISDDPQVADFGGTVVYENKIELDQVPPHPVLNLGRVNGTTQVFVNGRDVGAIWYGRHEYDLDGYLVDGRNEIRIEVITTLANHLRSLKDNPTAQRLAGWSPVISMGLEQNPIIEIKE